MEYLIDAHHWYHFQIYLNGASKTKPPSTRIFSIIVFHYQHYQIFSIPISFNQSKQKDFFFPTQKKNINLLNE